MNTLSCLLASLLACVAVPVLAQDAPKPAPRQYELDGGALKLPGPVLFEAASDKLAPDSEPALRHVLAYLQEKAYITLMRIENHTDADGSPAISQALSEKRALATAKWLTARGANCTRLIAVGFGGNKPVAANDTPQNKAANRRTMFVNAALRGRAIGGMPVDGGGRVAGDPCK